MPINPVDPNSTNPGKNVQYDPNNPFNVGVKGTGNFTDISMPTAPVPVNPTPLSKPPVVAQPNTPPPGGSPALNVSINRAAGVPDNTPVPPANNPLVSQSSSNGITTAPPELPVGTDTNPVTPSISLPGGAPPATPNFQATYDALRSSTGVAGFQTSLANLQTEKASLQANLTGFELNEPTGESQGFSNARMTEAERNTNARLAYLNIQETALNSQIANANTYINESMQLNKDDYSAAVTAYNTAFDQAVRTQDLYNQKASDEQKSAAAYLQTTIGMISTSGKQWDDISSAMKATIQLEEQKAGWPTGTLEAFAKSKPNANIISTIQGIDPNTGDKNATIIYQNDDGSFGMSKTFTTGTPAATGQYSTSTGNNPLNITLGSATQKYVNSGQATIEQANGLNFLHFNDPAVGLQAAKDLLFNPQGTYANMTVDQAMKTWSGNGYNGSIVKGQGVDPAALIRDLPTSQRDTLIQAMAKAEGGNLNTQQRAPGTTGSPKIDATKSGYATTQVVGGLTQAAIDQDALATALGQPLPVPLGLSGTGKTAAERTAINNRMAELNTGGNIAANKGKLVAYNASLKDQTEFLNSTQRALSAADTGLKQLTSAFAGKVNSNTIPVANIIGNAVLYHLSPSDVASYKAALAEVGNEYSLVFSRGGQNTVASHFQAADIIDGNISVADLDKVGQELQAQGNIVVGSAQNQIQSITNNINSIVSGGSQQSHAPGTIITNSQGKMAKVNADGTVTPL